MRSRPCERVDGSEACSPRSRDGRARDAHRGMCRGVHTLVAFSGTVIDGGAEFTEPGMNRFPESQTPKRFGEGDYQVLVEPRFRKRGGLPTPGLSPL